MCPPVNIVLFTMTTTVPLMVRRACWVHTLLKATTMSFLFSTFRERLLWQSWWRGWTFAIVWIGTAERGGGLLAKCGVPTFQRRSPLYPDGWGLFGGQWTCVQRKWTVVTHWRAMSPLEQGWSILSVTFDTVDILLHHLHSTIGLSNSIYKWFSSYLSGRTEHAVLAKPNQRLTGFSRVR